MHQSQGLKGREHEQATVMSTQAVQKLQQDTQEVREHCDVRSHVEEDTKSAEERLAEALDSLDSLTGLEQVKQEIRTLTNFLRLQRQRAAAGLPQTDLSLHLVFGGNPGTGKTTVALHRMAYLNYKAPGQFRADRMLVVVWGEGLQRFISKVLPSLGLPNARVMTYERWAARLRVKQVPDLPTEYAEDTPSVVTRLKKHPVLLRLVDEYADGISAEVEASIVEAAKKEEGGAKILREWRLTKGEAAGEGGEGERVPCPRRLLL